ncbi:MAG: hypothetical protein JSV68_02195 [Anaerolineaceae bacterium]|nr:MAG: hypothetical protein JSV68_02195 [Anaerolineaceae bacterium]
MAKIKITFHNKIDIRAQAQIFVERTLVSTGVADPGKSCILLADAGPYDIYFKHGVTGWELARKLDGAAKTVTLSQRKGRYTIS